MNTEQEKITVEKTVKSPIQKVWEMWTAPKHIVNWTNPGNPQPPRAESDVRDGGKFKIKLAPKDGSPAFDFEGIYTKVKAPSQLDYTVADGRKVQVRFEEDGQLTKITETFEPEGQNPVDTQRNGWQSILDNFKRYAEKN